MNYLIFILIGSVVIGAIIGSIAHANDNRSERPEPHSKAAVVFALLVLLALLPALWRAL